jgi:isoquinoline 1-oxidoreductase beta subunit
MNRPEQIGTTRRGFLVRSAVMAAGGLLGIALPGVLGNGKAGAAGAAGTSSFTPSIWFTITPDGKTTMHIIKAEMGQHVGTALAQVIAEELELNWADVRLDAPLESVENFAIYLGSYRQ